jgi:hypothetical protein
MLPLLSIGYSVKTRRQSPWTPSFGQSIKVTAAVLPLAERPMPLAIARQRRQFNRRGVGRSAVDRQSAAGRCGRSELSRLAVNRERRADHVRPCWGLTSGINAGVATRDRTGLERRMKALEPDFAELDGVIVQVERVIHLFRECGVEDLVAMVKQGLAAGILPGVAALLCSTDGEQRAAVAAYYQRLAGILKVEAATEAPWGPV